MMKNRKTESYGVAGYVTLFLCYFVTMALVACSSDGYETGDGKYSYLRADFVEAHTSNAKLVDYAINDLGQRLYFNQPLSVNWAEKADTFYRALAYYNDKPGELEALGLAAVYVLKPIDADKAEPIKTDPVSFESLWLSKCQRPGDITHYLNISFLLKTGQPDDTKAQQSIGVMRRQVGDTLLLTLLHDQGNVPEYYSTRVYASIPLDTVLSDGPVFFTANTYSGQVTKQVRP